jgi:hypothetical protein
MQCENYSLTKFNAYIHKSTEVFILKLF